MNVVRVARCTASRRCRSAALKSKTARARARGLCAGSDQRDPLDVRSTRAALWLMTLLALGCGRIGFRTSDAGADAANAVSDANADAPGTDALGMDAFSVDAFSEDDAFDLPDTLVSLDAVAPDAFAPDAFVPPDATRDAFAPDAFVPPDATRDAFTPDAPSGGGVLALGPSHYFRFDGDGIDAVFPAAPPLCSSCTYAPSAHGSAALVNTMQTVRGAVPLTSYTVSVWYRIDSPFPGAAAACGAVHNGSIEIEGGDEPPYVLLYGGGGGASSTSIADDVWTHVAYTFNTMTNEARLYVNGVFRNSSIRTSGSSLAPFTFGCDLFPIDELATFERMLTPGEIASLAAM